MYPIDQEIELLVALDIAYAKAVVHPDIETLWNTHLQEPFYDFWRQREPREIMQRSHFHAYLRGLEFRKSIMEKRFTQTVDNIIKDL